VGHGYNGRRKTPNFSCVTERGAVKMERATGSEARRVCVSIYNVTGNIFTILISTRSVTF
jgi:hypothetical protein